MNQHLPNENQTFQLMPVNQPEMDEIDLFELFSGLVSQWRLMLKIFLAGMLFLAVYLILAQREYGASIQIRPMTTSDLALINQQGVSTYSINQLYGLFLNTLTSPDNLLAFAMPYKLFEHSLTGPDTASGISVHEKNKFLSGVSFQNISFNGKIIKAKNNQPYRIKYSWGRLQNADQAPLINNYAEFTSKKVLGRIEKNEKLLIQIKLEKITKEIKGLRYTVKETRQFTIARLTSVDRKKIADYTGQINILKQASKKDILFRLSQLEYAYTLAKALKLKRPFLLNNNGAPKNKGGLILRMDAQSLPEYYSGTIALSQKIRNLKKKKLLDQYAKQINELKKNILVVEQDPELAALKARKSDDPYILKLPDLLNIRRVLEQKSINFQSITLFHFERKALFGKLVKPKSVLILILGAFLIGFIALLAGMVRMSFLNHKARQNAVT